MNPNEQQVYTYYIYHVNNNIENYIYKIKLVFINNQVTINYSYQNKIMPEKLFDQLKQKTNPSLVITQSSEKTNGKQSSKIFVEEESKSWTLIKTIPILNDLEKSFPIMTDEQISINLIEIKQKLIITLSLASFYNKQILDRITQKMKQTQFYLINRHILQNIFNVKTNQKDTKKLKQITSKFDQQYVNGYLQTQSQEQSIDNQLNKLKLHTLDTKPEQIISLQKQKNELRTLKRLKKKQYRAKLIQRRQQFVQALYNISEALFKTKNQSKEFTEQATKELFQKLINQLNQKISNTSQIKSTSSMDSQQNLQFQQDKKNINKQSQSTNDSDLSQNSSIVFQPSIKKSKQDAKQIQFSQTTGYKFFFKNQYHEVTQIILKRSKPIYTKNRNPLLLDFGFNRFIYKNDDQLAHQIIAMKLIKYFNLIINGQKKNKENIIVQYEIIPQAKGALYEFVQNSMTIAHIKKNFQNLSEYFKYLSDENKVDINTLRKRFAQTYAGFCVVQFLLSLKDRNNANIMIRNDGSILHIDLAFIFQSKPGGINFQSAPFKMTKQYVKVMGGFDSDNFAHFQSILIQIFTKLSECKDEFLSKLIILSSRSKQIRCFKGFSFQKYCQEKICTKLQKVRQFIQQLIDDSYDNWRTKKYDAYQFKTNKIPE